MGARRRKNPPKDEQETFTLAELELAISTYEEMLWSGENPKATEILLEDIEYLTRLRQGMEWSGRY